MKTYNVTLIKTWTQVFTGKDANDAIQQALNLGMDVEANRRMTAELVGPDSTFEYRIRIVRDNDEYQHGDLLNEAGHADLDQYGCCGWILERREADKAESHTAPDYGWEHFNSCFGYIASPSGIEFTVSRAQERVPEGCDAEVIYEV